MCLMAMLKLKRYIRSCCDYLKVITVTRVVMAKYLVDNNNHESQNNAFISPYQTNQNYVKSQNKFVLKSITVILIKYEVYDSCRINYVRNNHK